MANNKYYKRKSDFFLAPYLPEENFGNMSSGVVQALAQSDVLPYALVIDDLPIILPKRTDVGVTGVGEGRNDASVLEGQYKVGAGTIPNISRPFMMIPRMPGDKTITHEEAEVWTVVADTAANIDTGSYFCFDVISSAGVHTKYMAWFDKNGDGSTDKPDALDCYDPVADTDDGINQTTTQGKREFVQLDISADTTAQDVSDCIQTAINTLTDVSAANGGGSSETVTITNDNNGAVMDAFDYDSTLTISVTTQGYDKIINNFDPTTDEMTKYFGFHFQSDNGSYDRIYDITGCSVAEHILKVASGEGQDSVMKEDISYMFGAVKDQYGDLTMLDKPRDPYGQAWSRKLSPFHNQHTNHGWHTVNGNETFTYNSSAVLVTWFGWEVSIEQEMTHEYDGGGEYASDVNHNGRNIKITIDVMPEDHNLYEMQREHLDDYDGDLLIQLKSILAGTSDNVYVQFDCDKLRVLPFDEKVKADNSPERYNIELVPAPDATIKYTIQTYIPNYFYGLGGS